MTDTPKTQWYLAKDHPLGKWVIGEVRRCDGRFVTVPVYCDRRGDWYCGMDEQELWDAGGPTIQRMVDRDLIRWRLIPVGSDQ